MNERFSFWDFHLFSLWLSFNVNFPSRDFRRRWELFPQEQHKVSGRRKQLFLVWWARLTMKNTIQSYCNILFSFSFLCSLRWLAKCILAQSQSSCENFERCCLSWIPFFILRRDVCTNVEGLWPSSFMSSHEQSSRAYTHTRHFAQQQHRWHRDTRDE